ncbi:MAG: pentapeptide repeat-containing protein [Methanotrichaceae archaeon]|nr:pentapeptide repeat-containing protein [Methanotrichaceae archaeon]
MANRDQLKVLRLGVKAWNQRRKENPQDRVYLVGADLHQANLAVADLRMANLNEADLGEANLRGSNLCKAHLDGARLRKADLRETFLGGAHLRNADLSQANLHRACLNRAIPVKTNMSSAAMMIAKAVTRIAKELLRHLRRGLDASAKEPKNLN